MRAKKYNREDLLDKAIEQFRRQGYSGTSTAELVNQLGVNRKSMYVEFGSKQALFEAALERYSKINLSRVLAPIEAANANAKSIHAIFLGLASASEGNSSGLGCLMANTAVERAALDPGSAKFVDYYLERLVNGFRNALENAINAGEIDAKADLDDLASFLAMCVVGISALIRAKAPSDQVYAITRGIFGQLGI